MVALIALLMSCTQPANDTLTEKKWYRSYTIKNGKFIPSIQPSFNERHWLYFHKNGAMSQLDGPGNYKSGFWKFNAATRTLLLSRRPSIRISYTVLQLSSDSMQVKDIDGTIFGLTRTYKR
jgi:hypothetical protein